MNYLKAALVLVLTLGLCGGAWAQRGHGGGHFHGGGFHGGFHHGGHVGVVIGAPFFWPGYWYGDPYYYSNPYYSDPLVVAPASPPVYVEQGQAAAQGSWYYCDSANAYYPYVRDCQNGWRTVAPQPAAR